MVMELQALRVPDAGPLTKPQLDSRGLRPTVRLDIPITDPVSYLLKIAGLLEDYATELRQIHRSTQSSALLMALEVAAVTRTVQQRVSVYTRYSRGDKE